MIKVGQVEAATSSQSNESTMEIDNNVYTTVLGLNFLPVHYFEIPVDVFGCYANSGSVECLIIA